MTQWREKVETEIHELEALEVPALPDVEDESLVRAGRGWGSAHGLLVAYDHLLEGLDRICHYHFELMNLGYGAYLLFYEVCRKAFPDISDQTIAKMVAASTSSPCGRTMSSGASPGWRSSSVSPRRSGAPTARRRCGQR